MMNASIQAGRCRFHTWRRSKAPAHAQCGSHASTSRAGSSEADSALVPPTHAMACTRAFSTCAAPTVAPVPGVVEAAAEGQSPRQRNRPQPGSKSDAAEEGVPEAVLTEEAESDPPLSPRMSRRRSSLATRQSRIIST